MKTLEVGHIRGVNLTRFLGAIGIVIFHYGCHDNFSFSTLCLSANDSLGSFLVTLFFIISGACLARTYALDFDLKRYFFRRWESIFPLFYCCYIFFAIAHTVEFGVWWKGIPFYRFIYTLLGCDGYISLYQPNFYIVGEWFLGVILGCYLLFPILRWLLRCIPYTTAVILVVGTYFIPFLPCFTRHPLQNIWSCVTIFYLGMLIAQFPVLLSKKVSWISTFLVVILLFFHIPYYEYLRLFGAIITGILLFISITNLGQLCEQNDKFKLILSKLGKLSFLIFLVQHEVIFFILRHYGVSSSVVTAMCGVFLSIVSSILLSWLILLGYEKAMLCFSRNRV